MKSFIVGFVVGAISASIVYLVLDQERTRPVEPQDAAESIRIPLPPSDYVETNREGVARPDDAPLEASLERPQQVPDAPSPFEELAESTQRAAQDVEALAQRSFDFKSNNRNRHEIFADEAADASAASLTLENTVTNEVWRVAGTLHTPVALDTECRSSGCRVRLAYGTDEELMAATRSTLSWRVLAALEQHGFVAEETVPEFAAREPDPDAAAQDPALDIYSTLDIYFWRDSQGG